MGLLEINWNPPRKELRVFAGLQLIFFAIVAWMIHHRFESTALTAAVVTLSAVAALVGFIKPQLLRLFYVGWVAAVFPIGWVVSHVLMLAVFYLVITPVGLTMRLCGRDPMERKFDETAKSYWKPRQQQTETKRYFRQF